MSRVLVTGATGFTGSHMTRRLLDEGFDVRILARPNADVSRLELSGAEICTGDVTDKDSVRRAVSGVDTVYHIAALYRQAGLPDSVYWAVNYDGTANLLQASMDEGVGRFVHCSTCGVHSSVKHPPADETAPYEPGDVYQRSKAKAEQEALRYQREYGFPVSVIRPVGIFGPGDTRWLKLFRSVSRRRFVMIGSGRTFIHLVYISDLIDAFRLAAEAPQAVGRVFIIGGDRYVTLNELAEAIAAQAKVPPPPRLHVPVRPVRMVSGACEDICRLIHVEPPIFRRRVDFFVKNRAFNISRAKAELGYIPKVTLEEGIRRTLNWYKEKGLV